MHYTGAQPNTGGGVCAGVCADVCAGVRAGVYAGVRARACYDPYEGQQVRSDRVSRITVNLDIVTVSLHARPENALSKG